MDYKSLMLSDALKTAINTEIKFQKLKRAFIGMSIANIILVLMVMVLVYGQITN